MTNLVHDSELDRYWRRLRPHWIPASGAEGSFPPVQTASPMPPVGTAPPGDNLFGEPALPVDGRTVSRTFLEQWPTRPLDRRRMSRFEMHTLNYGVEMPD
jgi:hypothetical protein